MKYLIIPTREAFEYYVSYLWLRTGSEMAGSINVFRKIVRVLTTEIHSKTYGLRFVS